MDKRKRGKDENLLNLVNLVNLVELVKLVKLVQLVKSVKFVKLVKPKHYNSLSAAGAQAAVCSNFGSRLSHDVNSHSINLIVGLLVYYMEATLRCDLHL